MRIAGIQKTTLIDWPGEIATTIFLRGCNLNCSYCHNRQLINSKSCDKDELTTDECIKYLISRKDKIKHIVITGGEPLMSIGINEFLFELKSNGFKIKLDTNGSMPNSLVSGIKLGLIDYVALDVKVSRDLYFLVTRTESAKYLYYAISRCLHILKVYKCEFEVRTTMWKEHHTDDEMKRIFDWLGGRVKNYYIQNFHRFEGGPDYTPLSKADGDRLVELAKTYSISAKLRGF